MPPPASISHSPTLPRLSLADHALFTLFAASHLNLHTLAEKSGRDLAKLTAWATAPEIRLYIDAYREVAGLSLLNTATAALLESIRLTTDPVEKRRAATALLRSLTPPRNPTRPSPSLSPSSPTGGGAALRGGGGSASTLTSPSTSASPSTFTSPPPSPSTSSPPSSSAPPSTSRPTSPSPPRAHPAHRDSRHSADRPTSTTPRAPISTPELTPAALLSSLDLPFHDHTFPGREPRTGIARLTTSVGLAGPAP